MSKGNVPIAPLLFAKNKGIIGANKRREEKSR